MADYWTLAVWIVNAWVPAIKGSIILISGVDPDGTVQVVFDKIRHLTGIESGVLFVPGTDICYSRTDNYSPISKYVQNNSTLFFRERFFGGAVLDDEEIERQQQKLAKEPPDYKVHRLDTPRTDLPDMITGESGDNIPKRALMPCGHAIGAESLTVYCRSLLDKGEFEFRCPYVPPAEQDETQATQQRTKCDEIWPLYLVRQCAVLTDSEYMEFHAKVVANYKSKSSAYKSSNGPDEELGYGI